MSPGLLVLSFPWTVCEEKKETEDKIEAAMKEEVVLDLGEEEEWK